jgi:hypothetical protein
MEKEKTMKDAISHCLHHDTPRLERILDDKEDYEPMYEGECHK